MNGRLYTCVRCGKNAFVPIIEGDDEFTQPKDWLDITPEEPEFTWACNTCAEIYLSFERAFRNNASFGMNPAIKHYNNIIEEVTKRNGSEQTPVEQHSCDAADACPIEYPNT